MDEIIIEIIDSLEVLLEDLPLKPKQMLSGIIENLKKMEEIEATEIIRISDELEVLSNMPNVDSFSRNTIVNALSEIGTLI